LWQQQEQLRFQELDSDYSDTQEIGTGFSEKKFAGDSLQFTGIDSSSRQRARRSYTYDDDSSSESVGVHSEDRGGNEGGRQETLWEKEETIFQSALARIRRAQENGKTEVKLSPGELAELEKRKKRMQTSATSFKSKRGGSSSGSSENDHRRRSDRDLVTVPLVQSEPRRRRGRYNDESPPHTAPGMIYADPDGSVSYTSSEYFPPSPNKGSPIRSRSSASVQQYAISDRHFSEGIHPASSVNDNRILASHEEDWTSVSRRDSVSSQNHSHDPFDYQVSDQSSPIPTQYMKTQNSGRRHASGPAQIQYSSVMRSPPIGNSSMERVPSAAPDSSSDLILDRQRHMVGEPDSQRSGSTSEDRENNDGYADGRSIELQREHIITNLPTRRPISSGRRSGRGRRS